MTIMVLSHRALHKRIRKDTRDALRKFQTLLRDRGIHFKHFELTLTKEESIGLIDRLHLRDDVIDHDTGVREVTLKVRFYDPRRKKRW